MVHRPTWFIACALSLGLAVPAFSADLRNMRNDKESEITAFSSKDTQAVMALYASKSADKDRLYKIFDDSVQEYLRGENLKCELRFVNVFQNQLYRAKLPYAKQDLINHLRILRVNHRIDDIFYEISAVVVEDYFALADLARTKAKVSGSLRISDKLLANNDVEEHYAPFRTWPDEVEQCAYQDYVHLKNITFNEKGVLSTETRDLQQLNSYAFAKGLIDELTFRKLEYLRAQSSINTRNLWMQDYFKVLFNAKNKMTPSFRPIYVDMDVVNGTETKFSVEKVKRTKGLTRRKLLYQKYDSTQIIQLAQVLQKASRRMGTDPDTKTGIPTIVQEFEVTERSGQRRTYVERHELDPQSQYNYARRMMRKDITALQMMDSYKSVKITFEDIIMASFETGYISAEDIDVVAKYDDLWNPTKTRFQRIMGFIFRLGGYSTFFVPPPFNLVASIGLGITESIFDRRYETGAENDNPNTIIE